MKVFKKVLIVLLCALLFGAVAGGTILAITKLAGASSPSAENAAGETEQIQTGPGTEESTEAPVTSPETAGPGESRTDAAGSGSSSGSESATSPAAVLDVSDIVEEAMPQLVSITNTMVIKQQGYSDIFDYFYGGGVEREYEVPASGSGVILSKTDTELLMVTNNHVVEDSKELQVTFIDGTTVDAAIKGVDTTIDLAVIAVPLESISDETMGKIKVAKLHTTDDLKVGQGVIAIGNALGYGQTVTVGFISALGREIAADEDTVYSDLIQVDAAINPGNSGGALLNMNGEVIGINVAKLAQTEVEGIGYSIPVYKANEVIENLSNARTRVEVSEDKQGRLGIYMNTVSQSNAKALGMPAGVIVTGFSDEETEGFDPSEAQESPAKEAGIRRYDIITKFDGQNVGTAENLSQMVKYYEAGDTVDITVQRPESGAYVETVITVTLGSKDDPKFTAVSPEETGAPEVSDTSVDDTGSDGADAAGPGPEASEGDAAGGGSGRFDANDMMDMFRQYLDRH